MSYNLSTEIIDRIISENNIVDVIEEYIPLKKAGANFNANCPFHNEKTPSFVVSPDKQIYHCFGCGASGNSINFLMQYKNYTFLEAAEYLAKKAGIVLVENNKNIHEDKLSNKLYKINQDAAAFFYSNIKKANHVLKYLNSRKITVDVIKTFGIGYSIGEWDNLLKYLYKRGYKEEDIVKSGLVIKNEQKKIIYDRFRNRIMFPIFDIRKRVIGFGARVLDNSLPKYLNSPESSIFNKGSNLYALNIAKENAKDTGFILSEGYMDVIKLHAYGYKSAVASLGTSFTENQVKLLKRYSKHFYIAFDSDNAGKMASLKAINLFKRQNLDAKVVVIDGAKDPDEFLNIYGKKKFDKLIENSLDFYSFLEYYYKDVYNKSNKLEYINAFFDNIVNVKSEIEKELIIEKLSNKVGVSKESIIKEYNKKNNKNIDLKNVSPAIIKNQSVKITTNHEEELIRLILINDDFALDLKDIITEDTFTNLKYYDIFKKIYEYKLNNINIDISVLKQLIDETDVFVQNTDDVDYNNLEALFKDCKKRLKIKYYEKIKNELTEKLKQSDNIENNSIMNEIFSLAKKIKSTKEEVN